MEYASIRQMQDAEAAYVAGIIDGEGTITLVKKRRTERFKSIQISVSSTSYSLVRILQDMTGLGSVSQKRKAKEHHRQSYAWSIHGNQQALAFLRAVLPFLREESKWKRAKKLLAEWNSVTKRNGKYNDKDLKAKEKFEREFFLI